mmetsp:Transcript_20456/g.27074  ORF Transcript_20456/g.27074 Transcript_20456/m.27074 type:complete len:156 (+) Transcript_20456:877-1344(+)
MNGVAMVPPESAPMMTHLSDSIRCAKENLGSLFGGGRSDLRVEIGLDDVSLSVVTGAGGGGGGGEGKTFSSSSALDDKKDANGLEKDGFVLVSSCTTNGTFGALASVGKVVVISSTSLGFVEEEDGKSVLKEANGLEKDDFLSSSAIFTIVERLL